MRDRAKQKAYNRAYRLANRDRLVVAAHAIYVAKREARTAIIRAYHLAHADEIREYKRNYYVAHREEQWARASARRKANPAQRGERQHAYYVAHRETILAQTRVYRASHPEVHEHAAAAYRSRKDGNGGSHTLAEWCEKCDLFANLCAYCGNPGRLEREHKIPLARGGTDDISNIVPACHSCNARKNVKTAADFLASLRRKAA